MRLASRAYHLLQLRVRLAYAVESKPIGPLVQGGPNAHMGKNCAHDEKNTNGQDVNFVAAVVASMKKSYCVDSSRIFSVGMSVGAIMTNMLGCGLGSVFRAIAPLASSAPLSFNTMPRKGEHVAAWFAHGTPDFAIPVEGGLATAGFRNANHCAATSQPASPAGCVTYDGCDPGYPVHWCAFEGGHEFPLFARQAIWNFFSQF